MGERRGGFTRAGFRRAGALNTATGTTSVNGAPGAATVGSSTPVIQQVGVAPAVTFTQTIQADWTLGICRVYAIDGVNGVDGRKGYADPASNSAADYATACAAAGAVAVKTFAGLAAILPRNGAGRTCEIVIANGGVNTNGTYAGTGGLGVFLNGVTGYVDGIPDVRTTGTNPTAGCTAFDGSAADCTYQGAITATGMNAAGYNPTGVPTTTVVQLLKVGGGAPGFGAEPALPLGARWRWDANTTTAALRNTCRQIAQITGTDTFVVTTAWAAVPVASDTGYIEMPGVSCGATNLGENTQGPVSNFTNLSGINFTGTLTLRCGFWAPGFLFATALSHRQGTFSNLGIYGSPVRGVLTVGGIRVSGATTFQIGNVALQAFVGVGAVTVTNPLQLSCLGTVCCAAAFVMFGGSALGTSSTNIGNTSPIVGVSVRIIGPGTAAGALIVDGAMLLNQVAITNAGAKAAIWVESEGVCLGLAGSSTPVVTGSIGNNDVGLDVSRSRGGLFVVNSIALPTVTGALGDIRVSDGVNAAGTIISWAQAAAGFIDAAGNRFIAGDLHTLGVAGSRGPRGILGKFSGAIVTSAVGATTSYLADSGSALAVANLATPQRYPTSLRLITRLRVTVSAVTGALSNAVTATLYKTTGGGAATATAMQVSIPSGTAVGTTFVDSAHPALFLDGDTYDVRLDDAGADAAAGTLAVSAVLEGPV